MIDEDDDGYGDVPVEGVRPPGAPRPVATAHPADSTWPSTPAATPAADAAPTQIPTGSAAAAPPHEEPPVMPLETESIPVVATPSVETAAEPAAAAAGPAAVDLSGVESRLETVHGAVQGFHERAEQYESIIRKMQSKIEDLQSDQVRTLLKPVIVRLADLYTEASRLAGEAGERGEKKTQKDFGYYADEIEEALELLDIESLDVQVGADFDASKQAARGAQSTEDPALDRKVAVVVRQGFTYTGMDRPMLPAIVKIYKYTEAAAPAAGEQASTEGGN